MIYSRPNNYFSNQRVSKTFRQGEAVIGFIMSETGRKSRAEIIMIQNSFDAALAGRGSGEGFRTELSLL